MFASITTFFLACLQFGLLALCYLKGWQETFEIFYVHFSPVMVFFAFIHLLTGFSGAISHFIWLGLIVCVVKYFFLARAIVVEEYNAFNVSSLLAEVTYVGLSSWYIITNNYIF